MQEELIDNIVIAKIEEELKNLETQHKNSLSVLERKLQDNENSFNIKLTNIESELETLRGKLATTIERLSRLERTVKITQITEMKLLSPVKVFKTMVN